MLYLDELQIGLLLFLAVGEKEVAALMEFNILSQLLAHRGEFLHRFHGNPDAQLG